VPVCYGAQDFPVSDRPVHSLAQEIVLGKRHAESNVFRSGKVCLNLPGSPGYNPVRPWVFKSRADGTLAADLNVFVDDTRVTGPTDQE
jgi:hypothetical protein